MIFDGKKLKFCSICILDSFKAIQKGNVDGARIHAENSIRQKNQVSRSIFDNYCYWWIIIQTNDENKANHYLST